MSLIVLYFLHSSSVPSLYIEVVLTLSIGFINILVQNKRHVIAWKHGDKGNMESPDLIELNQTDKPNDTTTNWSISFEDSLYFNF